MYEIFVHEKKYVRREKVVHLADLDNKFAFVTFDSVPPEKNPVVSSAIDTNIQFGIFWRKTF